MLVNGHMEVLCVLVNGHLGVLCVLLNEHMVVMWCWRMDICRYFVCW